MRMPRQLRQGARYHVTARINRKEMLLGLASTRNLFLATVARAKRKYHFHIWNFCVMGNHVHFLIEPDANENLSDIMRWILGVFAMAYNRRLRLSGHVWGDRFHSRIIDGIRDFVLSFSYIEQNPRRAGLIENNAVWIHCGLYHARMGIHAILDVFPAWLHMLFPEYAVQPLPS